MEDCHEVIHLELKYCERCGALWIRHAGSEEPYCVSCAEAVRQMSPSSRHRTKPRMPGEKMPPRGIGSLDGAADWGSFYDAGGTA